MPIEKQAKEDRFLTPEQVMAELKISAPTFYRMAGKGKIPGAFKFGNQWRINARVFHAAGS